MKSTLYILIILLSFGFAQQAMSSVLLFKSTEEKIAELQEAEEDSNKVVLSQDIAIDLRRSDADKGIEYGLKGLELAKKIGWEKGEAICYNSISICYRSSKEDYVKAIEFDKKALQIYKELDDTLSIGSHYFNIGYSNYRLFKDSKLSSIDTANHYFLKAETLYKEIKAYKELSRHYRGRSSIFKEEGDYKKALEFHEKYSYAIEKYLKKEHEEEIDTLSGRMYEDIVLEKEQIRETEQEKMNQITLYFSIGIIALLLVIVFLVYRLRRLSGDGKDTQVI